VQGVISSLVGLAPSSQQYYLDALDDVAQLCAPNASTVELQGYVRVASGRVIELNDSVPLSLMQNAARRVGAYIATRQFPALAGHSVQDIETWDDADEAAASNIASKLQQQASIVGAGDDAQIIAGCALALLQDPTRYDTTRALVDAALDDSFARDPYWGR